VTQWGSEDLGAPFFRKGTNMRLSNKVILVTGAASGIGAAATRLFAAEGAKVVATDRQIDRLDALVAELPKGSALALTHDVASDEGWRQVVARAIQHFGRIDVLLNNAGVSDRQPVPLSTAETTVEADWDRVMAVNLKGPWLGIKHVLPGMKAQGAGSIINVSSVAALIGSGGPFAYTASKGGLRSMTKHVAVHYGRFGIRANSIHPGGVRTPMIEEDMKNPDIARAVMAQIPLGRIAEPSEIAELALFLASDGSSYLTGAELTVDGGLVVA
jgi:cyclopentanol dehydrogenase